MKVNLMVIMRRPKKREKIKIKKMMLMRLRIMNKRIRVKNQIKARLSHLV